MGPGDIPQAVLVATITSASTLIVAIVSGVFSLLANIRAGAARKHAKVAAFGVTNQHSVNLRDDLDIRFDALDTKVVALTDQAGTALAVSERALETAEQANQIVIGTQADIRGLRRDIGRATDLALDANGHRRE